MTILFSVAVHESSLCVDDLVMNIRHFVPDSHVILHLKYGFKYEIKAGLENYVSINPVSLKTGFMDGSLTYVHLSNFLYSKRLGKNFSYFCPFGSNQLFIKHGFENYIRGAVKSESPDVKLGNFQAELFKIDPFMKKVLKHNHFRKSVPEGTFYDYNALDESLNKEVNLDFLNKFEKNYTKKIGCFYRKLSNKINTLLYKLGFLNLTLKSTIKFTYATEEIFFPSLISGDFKTKPRYCYTPWDKPGFLVTVDCLGKLLSNDTCYYSVKRVNRDPEDKVRIYIKEICGNFYK